ncbi:MAG TPA: isoprenylcysteine carboxylmethyltransferase family protein [Xanthomonadales bacterium]|nr:isoprenylcysteine carboxylmethyltransferase family protein [Xanthomonadales bacterium]
MTESEQHSGKEDSGSSRMSRFGFRKPRIFPPFWLLLCALALFALDRWLPLVQLYPSLPRTWNWLLLAPGLVLIIIAMGGFIKAKTGAVPFSKSTVLVTGGIYRFTRNPMYLGMALVLAGAAIRLGSLSAWLPVVFFVFIIQRQFVRNEEIFLSAIYGDEFHQYCRKVRPWL